MITWVKVNGLSFIADDFSPVDTYSISDGEKVFTVLEEDSRDELHELLTTQAQRIAELEAQIEAITLDGSDVTTAPDTCDRYNGNSVFVGLRSVVYPCPDCQPHASVEPERYDGDTEPVQPLDTGRCSHCGQLTATDNLKSYGFFHDVFCSNHCADRFGEDIQTMQRDWERSIYEQAAKEDATESEASE